MQPQTPHRPLYWAEIIYDLQNLLADTPELYLVGGTVRDAFRDVPFKDIDMAVAGDGRPIARRIANAFSGDYYALDAEREVGRALLSLDGQAYTVDVAAWRGPDLRTDLYDRDFTINAMAVPLASDLQAIIDPLGGMRDWLDRILRCCTPQSIAQDPIRALRAVRLSLDFGLTMEPATRADVAAAAEGLRASSAERRRDALFGILHTAKPVSGLALLRYLGLMPAALPDLAPLPDDAWRSLSQRLDKLNTLMAVISPRRDDNIAANAEFGTFVYLLDRYRRDWQAYLSTPYPDDRTGRELMLLAAALRDVAPSAKALTRDLALSREESQHLNGVWQGAEFLQGLQGGPLPDPRTIYHFWHTYDDHGLGALLLTLADYLAERGLYLKMPDWTHYLQGVARILAGWAPAREASPVVNGEQLMAYFELEPGPLLGDLLGALREANALGEVTTEAEAYALAEQLLASLNG